MRFIGARGAVELRPAWFDRLTTNGWAGLAALAVGLLLGLAAMPGCGSGCPTPEERTYLNALEDWSERTVAGGEDLFPILQEGGDRPELVLDEGWRGRLKRVLDELTSAQEAMINVEVPSRGRELHRLLVRIAEAIVEGNELIWQSALDVDAEKLQMGLDSHGEVDLLIEEATTMAKDFCE